MDRREALRRAYAASDPEVPADAQLRVFRPKSPVGPIQDWLRSGFAPAKFALVGGIGTGKSTELLRVADGRPPTTWVLLVQVDQQLDKLVDPAAIEELQAWELVVLAGLALLRVGDESGWTDPSGLARFSAVVNRLHALSSADTDGAEVDVGKLAKALGIGVIAAAGSLTTPVAPATLTLLASLLDFASLKWRLGRRRPLGQDAGLESLVDAVNALLRPFEAQGHQVLLLLDGLDKIRSGAAARRLFVESDLLAGPRWNIVSTAPVTLLRDNLLGTVRGLQPRVLAEVPIATREDPWTLSEEGRAFFRKVVELRLDPTGVTVETAAIDRLAWLSGGRVRDFMHLLRESIVAAFADDTAAIGMPHAIRAIDSRRRLKEGGMHAGHVEILRALRDDPERRLPAPPERADGRNFVQDLLDAQNIVVLPNESEWYFPHPLLTLNVVPKPG